MKARRWATVVLLVGVALLLAPAAARAQRSSADDEVVRKLYIGFFDALRQAGPGGAVAYLRLTGTLSPGAVEAMWGRLQAVQARAGRADSYVVVNEMEIPHSLRYRTITFLTHHENAPVGWRLRFYQQTNGVWVVSDVDFELQFVEDFLRLPEIEFAAHRAVLDRLPTKSELRQMLKDAAESGRR